MIEKAKEKLLAEDIKHDTPEDMARNLILGWLEYQPETAALLINNKDVSVAKCYAHIKKQARALKSSEVNAGPTQEVEWMLDYFGIEKDEAQNLIEGGLMYAIFQAMSKPWQPYQRKDPKKVSFSLEDLL